MGNILGTGAVVFLTICAFGLAGIYPVPFTPVTIGTSICTTVMIPAFLVFGCLPDDRRKRRKELLWGFGMISIIIVFGASLYPLLWLLWVHATVTWRRAIIAALFVSCRIFVDNAAQFICRRLCPDEAALILVESMVMYSVQMVLLTGLGDVSWEIFCVLVSGDVLETCFLLWRACRSSTSTEVHRRHLVGQLVAIGIREVIELISPLHGITMLLIIGKGNSRSFAIFDSMSEESFRHGLVLLGIDFLVEAIVLLCFTTLVIRIHKQNLLRLTMAAFHQVGPSLMADPVLLCWFWFPLFLSAHMGVDWSFTFPWLQGDGYGWLHGLCWEGHSQADCEFRVLSASSVEWGYLPLRSLPLPVAHSLQSRSGCCSPGL